MRRMLPFALLGLLALTATSRAGCPLGACCPDCRPIPCVPPCDCGCPCDNRMHLNFFDRSTEDVATLRSVGCAGTAGCGCGCGDGSNSCERIKAAEKLGSRFHADFCCNPEVLEALVGALECDSCWEVRHAAAWSIMLQGARTEEGVLALYIASKADPHYMVRARAAEALDILTVCCKPCYTELYKAGDAIVKELKFRKYKPGMENCCGVFGEAAVAGRVAYANAAAVEAALRGLPPMPPAPPEPTNPRTAPPAKPLPNSPRTAPPAL